LKERIMKRYAKNYVPGIFLGNLCGLLIVLIILWHSPAAYAVEVTLAWDPPEAGTVDGYMVFSRLEGESYDYSKPVWEGSENTCTLSHVQDATTYFIARAYNSSGESGDSNEAMYEPATSSPPTTSTPTTSSGGGGGGAGCFIATAATSARIGAWRQLVLFLGMVLYLGLLRRLTRIKG
jgi:hypothetical protein